MTFLPIFPENPPDAKWGADEQLPRFMGRCVCFWYNGKPGVQIDSVPKFVLGALYSDNNWKKILRIARTYIETGNFPYNEEKFKHVEGQPDLYVVKVYQLRLFGTYLDRYTFGICLCVNKKKDKLRTQDINKALNNRDEMKKSWKL
jgi:hypothetical protein